MFPPTPTPLPAAPVAPIVLDATRWRVWAFTDEAIMIWQQMQRHNMGTVIQIAVILIIVIFFVVYITRLAQALTDEGTV
jgi:hypothetical protein